MATKKSATELFDHYYQALVFLLPMKDANFIDELFKHGLIAEDFKPELEKMIARKERASYFLDCIIKPGLTDNTNFSILISIIKNGNYNDNVKDLAEHIESQYIMDTKCKFVIVHE